MNIRAFVMAVTALLVMSGCGGSEPSGPDEGDDLGAKAACDDFVKDQLKKPSTADFSDRQATQENGPVWTVTGNVVSENLLGEEITNRYACTVTYAGNDKWTLTEMNGLGK